MAPTYRVTFGCASINGLAAICLACVKSHQSPSIHLGGVRSPQFKNRPDRRLKNGTKYPPLDLNTPRLQNATIIDY